MKKKNIVILGSSGSIGENALDVVRQFKNKFRVLGLCVNANTDKLMAQVKEFRPEFAAVADIPAARAMRPLGRWGTKVLQGRDGVCRLASLKEADLILVAIVGSEAIFPILSAIRASKTIALANKEAIVVAGDTILAEAGKYKAQIIPIDSEQSAIFQCLRGNKKAELGTIYLTASGGPLVDMPLSGMNKCSVDKVLVHPRWKMGEKITVDSATLMNKGLEVIEAMKLFDIGLERIKVLIHRQAIIHSMVEFQDGSMLAQMAVTDMRLPIQYALTFPERWQNDRFRLDILNTGVLSFSKPDLVKFPCLELAYEAARLGGAAPCALNAANEVAVDAFLRHKISFGCIPKVIEKVVEKKDFSVRDVSLDNIFNTDKAARERALQLVEFYGKRGR
ncbi:MAG: 1-deoxy-D-xylulose-5-phosphate reductoisomerase [Candidatus Omnitrophica bacterium CG1_02_44_16]|nr:MAG: 1-deoxy-D-xylulose-5-phosphate reductoisomerase [Candidatus Omnitrophica bacterium CG1_02_44_16]